MTTARDPIHSQVEEHYAAAANAAAAGTAACCGPETPSGALPTTTTSTELPDAAVLASLGCGNPTAVADLARRRDRAGPRLGRRHRRPAVGQRGSGPTGRRLRARHDAPRCSTSPAATPPRPAPPTSSSSKATSRPSPCPTRSVDVVISNCVINLSPDKPAVFAEIHRVLRPGGRIGDHRRGHRGPALRPSERAELAPTSAASPARSRSAST